MTTTTPTPTLAELDRPFELWTVLHKPTMEDLAAELGRLRAVAQGLSTAVLNAYVENVEMVPTPEESLADARMVHRLVEHLGTMLEGVVCTVDDIRSKASELLQLAERASGPRKPIE